MPASAAQKLKIKEGFNLLTINAPSDFRRHLGELPPGVKIVSGQKNYNQVHWFVMNKAQMDKQLNEVLKLVTNDVMLWIYYPKGTSKLQTDLTRDKGWDSLLKHNELTWINLISFDDTWSAFGSRLKTDADKKRKEISADKAIFDYVNPKTKAVKLPSDLEAAFKKNKKQEDFFNTLSFTNKKEYIEWVISAKRQETRSERVKGTVERLLRGWKNPRNT